MTLFTSTLNQMAFLLLLMGVGFVLVKTHVLPDSGTQILSKLENNVFIPALVMGTFMSKFTPESIHVSGNFLLWGLGTLVLTAPIGILMGRFFAKDRYTRNIFTYGLVFSNFGFMGNAVVNALFPDVFMGYLIFVLPFWTGIYLWGVPVLLMDSGEQKRTLGQWLKPFVNPMLIGMLIGAVVGITRLPVPSFLQNGVDTLGSCMSPIAMLLTGMTIAKIDLKAAFQNGKVYLASVLRLVLIPLAAMAVLWLIKAPADMALCVTCCLAMPLGLSPVVVPAAYGKDTTAAAGMALISHLLSCISIPLIFWLFERIL